MTDDFSHPSPYQAHYKACSLSQVRHTAARTTSAIADVVHGKAKLASEIALAGQDIAPDVYSFYRCGDKGC